MRRLEKNWKVLRCIQVLDLLLNSSLDINERNWIQFIFDFILLVYRTGSFVGMNFSSSVGQVSSFWLPFSHFAMLQKRLQLESRTDLTTKRLVAKFFVKICLVSSSLYSYGLKSARIAQLCVFFDDRKFFRQFRLKGSLVCSLSVVLFGWPLAIRYNFTCSVRASLTAVFSKLVTLSWHGYITCKNKKRYMRSDVCKNARR